jgi:hypothetical protein
LTVEGVPGTLSPVAAAREEDAMSTTSPDTVVMSVLRRVPAAF